MPEVVMPRLSDSMEEGVIARWLKADGEEIARGEELVEIDTDKATMTYEAEAAGVLRIMAEEGAVLPIGAVIARIGDGGMPEAPAPTTYAEPSPSAPAAEAEAAPPLATAEGTGGVRARATPVARRLARELGVDLVKVQGTGPEGRIVKADVQAAARGDGAPVAEPRREQVEVPPRARPTAAVDADATKGVVERQELSRLQKTVARRMVEATSEVPGFQLQMQIDMERCIEQRRAFKEEAVEGDVVPSINDFIVRAAALALRAHPRANGSFRDGAFELYSRVNVGVAVAAADALVVPTVFDADQKSIGQIARETRALAHRIRAGAVSQGELSGGTFTVSNLGMFGVASFNAVINPPQAAILAVGAVQPTAVVRDGELVARSLMSVTLTCDHRILYGAEAAEFLGHIRDLLEKPLRLI